jgi:hypothetical protein
MGDDVTGKLLGMMEEALRGLATVGANIESLTENLARHQEELAALAECVSTIKLERAAERGYVAGALAAGGVIGGLAVKLLM